MYYINVSVSNNSVKRMISQCTNISSVDNMQSKYANKHAYRVIIHKQNSVLKSFFFKGVVPC